MRMLSAFRLRRGPLFRFLQQKAATLPQAAITDLAIEASTSSDNNEETGEEDETLNQEDGAWLPKTFKTLERYQRYFKRVMAGEKMAEMAEVEAMDLNDVRLSRWDPGDGKTITAYFAAPKAYIPSAASDYKRDSIVNVGSRMFFNHSTDDESETWNSFGIITKLPEYDGDELAVSFTQSRTSENLVPMDKLDNFDLQLVKDFTPFERMEESLDYLCSHERVAKLHPYFYHRLLGLQVSKADNMISEKATKRTKKKTPKKFKRAKVSDSDSMGEFRQVLDHSQRKAFDAAVQSYLTLIQGPPGTGKSVTCTSIIRGLLVDTSSRQDRIRKVLVCSPSNTAIDQLCERLVDLGIPTVRVYSRSFEEKEAISSGLLDIALHTLLKDAIKKHCTHDSHFNALHGRFKPRSFEERAEELLEIEAGDGIVGRLQYQTIVRQLADQILNKTQVVCTTCSAAGSPHLRLSKIPFSAVVVDEAAQSAEPETLIPIRQVIASRRSQSVDGVTVPPPQIVLVGDHKQLVPLSFSTDRRTKAAWGRSLFARLIESGVKPLMLKTQYRMHPALAEFPAGEFYDGLLRSGITAEDRAPASVTDIHWPDPDIPMFFWWTDGIEEGESGGSKFNRLEAEHVVAIVIRLLSSGRLTSPEQIGVITHYNAQKILIKSLFRQNHKYAHLLSQVEVSSVDAYQGREKDLVVLSSVRSHTDATDRGGEPTIGFLTDANRLNVAITRARYGLIVIGNPRTLSQASRVWRRLIKHFRERSLLVTGESIDALSCFDGDAADIMRKSTADAVIHNKPTVKNSGKTSKKSWSPVDEVFS